MRHDTYPHLRELASALPNAPGVYFFYGASTLPLYIGKSVNIRTRVLSHLRAADEARMLQQTQRFSYQLTAGEMGALLLEAQLIKQHQPLYNHKLRRNRQLCLLQLFLLGIEQRSTPCCIGARRRISRHRLKVFNGFGGLALAPSLPTLHKSLINLGHG